MAQTTNLQLTLLEVGQKEKEVTINTNMSLIDSKSLRYLGEFAADPATTGVMPGSTYYDTAVGKFKILKTDLTWQIPDASAGQPTQTDTFKINNELILDASAKIAQESTGQYGWNDLVAHFVVKATAGLNNPSWGTLFGNMQGYLFGAGVMSQIWSDFHINHDVAIGTVLYPHIHWCPTTTATGVVRWGIEYSVAKGHGQSSGSVFPASTTVYIEQNVATASQWKHFTSEVSLADAIPATNIEPDSVIKIRIFRDGGHANDTYPDDVHAWQSDIHFQTNTLSTKNKAPDFYA